MGARFLSNPHFRMAIVKISGYYKAFCQNRWVQLDISQNRWVQLHPLTRSNEGSDFDACTSLKDFVMEKIFGPDQILPNTRGEDYVLQYQCQFPLYIILSMYCDSLSTICL